MKANSVICGGLRRMITAIAGLSAVTLAVIPSAEARGTGGLLGNPYLGSKSGCFNEVYGGVVNNCSSTEWWTVMAPIDGDGQMNFYIRARGVANQVRRVGCNVISTNGDLSVINWSSHVETSRLDGAVELLQTSVNVPGWGSNHAFCSMDAGTTILSMHYPS